MDEIAITVKDLKIRYKSVQAYSIKKSLLRLKSVDTKAFEAVRGVSFEVKKGEILGITGKNGSGKSTLLRALANIFSPDEGTIDLHGHSISLLAIGVGFTASTEQDIWNIFPQIIKDVFGGNVVAVVFVVAMILSYVLPENMEVHNG